MLEFFTAFVSTPAFIIGFIALIGLIALRKSTSDVIKGTLKTILGFMILQAGAGIIVNGLIPFSQMFSDAFGLEGVIAEDNSIAAAVQSVLSMETSFILLFGFLINLVLARFTPLKYIFLTGHMMFSMAATIAIVLDQMGVSGWNAVLIGMVIQGLASVIFPAMAQPFVRKVTGNDNVAFGFYGSSLIWFTAWIGGLLGTKPSPVQQEPAYVGRRAESVRLDQTSAVQPEGQGLDRPAALHDQGNGEASAVPEASRPVRNKYRSTEDMHISPKLGFLKEMSVLMSIVMVLIYGVTAAFTSPELLAELSAGKPVSLWVVTNALTFVVGVLVLLQGVRMFLAELVPAFKGVSEKLVPGAKPALDVPIFYSFAPNATTIGFIMAMLGGLSATALSSLTSVVVLPSVIGLFFMGAAAGVFGNATGGRRGAIIAGFLLGFLFQMIVAVAYPLVGLGDYGIAGLWFASTDAIIVIVIMRMVGALFGV